MGPPRRLLRLLGLASLAWIQALALLRLHLGGAGALTRDAGVLDWGPLLASLPGPALAAAVVALGLGLAALFWATTDARAADRGWTRPGLLLQLTLGLAFSTDALVVVAVQTPFVLEPPAALRAAAAQLAAIAAAGLGAGAAGLLAPLEPVAGAPPWLQGLLAVVTLAMWQAVAFGVGYVAATEGRERLELGLLNADLAATQQLLAANARLAERSRVARALHERLSRRLAALAVALEAAARLAEGEDGEVLRQAHAAARELAREAGHILSEIREGRALDLRAALEALVRPLSRPAVHLELAEGLSAVGPGCAHAVFRCAQEGLTNALRHGEAANVWLSVGREEDLLRLEVRDDGRGASLLVEGNGLRGMRDRVREMGGSLDVETAPGRGLRLVVAVPDREG